MEGTNAIIKKEHTLRERLPVGQFVNVTESMVRQWSKRRDPRSINCVFFSDTRSISLKLWTAAYQWVAQKTAVLQRSADDCTQYFTFSSQTETEITPKIVKKYESEEGKWKTFEGFCDWRMRIWKIEVSSNYVAYTCPYLLKKNECKHSVGIRIKRKEVEVPVEAKNIPLGKKRKRGRPSKSKKALLV